MFAEDGEEHIVVDSSKVVFDVCFECVAGDVVFVCCFSSLPAVLCRLLFEFFESFDCVVRSFSFSARVAVVDESWFIDWLEDVDERVVDDAVAEVALADDACFWVSEDEALQWLWLVGFRFEFVFEKCEVEACSVAEFLNARVECFSFPRFFVCCFEIAIADEPRPEVFVGFHGVVPASSAIIPRARL